MNTSRRVYHTVAVATAVAALGLSSHIALAADVVVQTAAQSLEIQYQISGTGVPAEGVYKVSQAQIATGMRVGSQTGGFGGTNATTGINGGIESLLFFQVPAIPAGQQLSGVSMRFSELTASSNAPDYNVDLYAVGFDRNPTPANDNPPYNASGTASANIAGPYYYFPTLNTDVDSRPIRITQAGGTVSTDSGPGAMSITRIQDDLLTLTDWNASAGGPTVHATSTTANTALLSFVQGLYARPDFAAGNYLILRMNPDAKSASTAAKRYQIPYNDPTVLAPTIIPELTFTFSPAPHFPGDTNNDGVVDLTDLNNVLNNFGSAGPNPGDDNSDGTVDLTDLNAVLNNFGSTHAAGALATVPEPATLSLLALGATTLLARRRR